MEKKEATIIIEGISTSGKTTVVHNLARFAAEHKIPVNVVPEAETVMPQIDSTDIDANRKYLLGLLERVYTGVSNLTIFDRLHYTHIIKPKAQLEELKEIEDLLMDKDATVFFLEIPPEEIRPRIIESMEYRDRGWNKYVLRRAGGDINQVVAFYERRQEELRQIFEQSRLSKYIIPTPEQNFVRATRRIIDLTGFKPQPTISVNE